MKTTDQAHPRGFELRVSDDDPDVAYVRLPRDPQKERKVAKSIRVGDLIKGYQGADVMLDFDDAGVLMGIEILA